MRELGEEFINIFGGAFELLTLRDSLTIVISSSSITSSDVSFSLVLLPSIGDWTSFGGDGFISSFVSPESKK